DRGLDDDRRSLVGPGRGPQAVRHRDHEQATVHGRPGERVLAGGSRRLVRPSDLCRRQDEGPRAASLPVSILAQPPSAVGSWIETCSPTRDMEICCWLLATQANISWK